MLVEVLTVFFLRQVYLILLVPLLAAVKDVDISREIMDIYQKFLAFIANQRVKITEGDQN